ncbi:MAG: hypothetical protein VX738_10630 [Planctomycetota bacterium]|nr:hypothetical protein [Planctomycetota bacterium]
MNKLYEPSKFNIPTQYQPYSRASLDPQNASTPETPPMTKVFEHAKLKFIYPENWTVIDSQTEGSVCLNVSLQNEGTIQWTVYRYEGIHDTEELIAQATRAIHLEYQDHEETEPYRQVIGEDVLNGRRMFFNYLDFILCMTATTIYKDDATYLFVVQAESNEYDENEVIFGALAISLLSNA